MSKIRSLVRDGHRDEWDRRRELWRSFVDVVEAVRPRAVLMENVPDMALGDDLRIVREIANRLEAAGYNVDYRLLDAWRYGVPQHRKRFFLQARADALPLWPAPGAKRPAVRDAIEDLPRLGVTTGARELPRQSRPVSEFALELIGDEKENPVFDHMTRPVRDDDREAFKLMSARTLYSELPEHLRRYRSDTFDDKYKRLSWEDLSRTITAHIAKDGYWYIHPEEHRTLTVREAARIQTFPDKFRFAGTRSDAFRQIGNAVPPALSAAVSSTLADVTVGDDRPSVPILRRAIDQWAGRRRQEAWWLFPGPGMGAGAALVASLLEVHRLSDEVAGSIMQPFWGLECLSMRDLLEVDAFHLSASRRRSMRRLRDLARAESGAVELHDASKSLLSPGQNATMDLLLNTEHLILSERIGLVVATLLNLPQESRGLKTDLKVGLAQLVGRGAGAAGRMCALRLMTVSAARSSVEAQGKN
jgi:DNA (cytosine-5)-methyltransferase 1